MEPQRLIRLQTGPQKLGAVASVVQVPLVTPPLATTADKSTRTIFASCVNIQQSAPEQAIGFGARLLSKTRAGQ